MALTRLYTPAPVGRSNGMDADRLERASDVPAPQPGEFTRLRTEHIDPENLRLVEDFHFHDPVHGVITIKAGFETDRDSVPRIPGIYAWLKNRSVMAAVVHDWLYHAGVFTRRQSDMVFKRGMCAEQLPRRRKYPIWLAVRVFGWYPWLKHRMRTDSADQARIIHRTT